MVRLYLLGYKGYKVLQSILKEFDSNTIYSVIIGRDSGVKDDYYDKIKNLCNAHSIHFINRQQDKNYINMFSIAIGWKWLIDINRIPNLIILHDSILPKYRGFNPLVTALINGDTEIGVTALYADKLCDQGDIIEQQIRTIRYPIKIKNAIELITEDYCTLVINIIKKIVEKKGLDRKKQNEVFASFSLWRDKEDYHINWNQSSSRIQRMIDAVGFPYDGAYSIINKDIIRVLHSKEVKDINIINRTPGKVINIEDGYPVVVCAKGLLKILQMKRADGSVYNLKNLRVRFK